MLTIDQILDTIDTSNLYNFDRTNFLIYANYMLFSTTKSIPPKVKCEDYYRTLYKHIESIYLRSAL
jgi:hypothetical protein